MKKRVKVFLFVGGEVEDETLAVLASDATGQLVRQAHCKIPVAPSQLEVDELYQTAQTLYNELEERLHPIYEIYFAGSCDERFALKTFGQDERQCLHISRASMPKQMKEAEEFFKILCARDGKANQYFQEDYPEIPCNTRLGKNCSKTKYFISYEDKDFEANARAHTAALSNKSLRKHYDLTDPRVQAIVKEHDRKKKLLLHICCGPDAAGVVRQLKEEFELTCFWYDPNIQPQQEHDKRLHAFEKVMKLEDIPYLTGEYDVENFYTEIKGLESTPEQGAKCSKCYDMRLDRAAREARDGGFDLYATTLAISPHKVQRKLQAFGEVNEKRYGVPYFHRNFMQDDGFKDSVDYTRANDIYRQDYCGCFFSLPEGGPAAQWLGQQLGYKSLDELNGDPLQVTAPEETFKQYETLVSNSSESDLKG